MPDKIRAKYADNTDGDMVIGYMATHLFTDHLGNPHSDFAPGIFSTEDEAKRYCSDVVEVEVRLLRRI